MCEVDGGAAAIPVESPPGAPGGTDSLENDSRENSPASAMNAFGVAHRPTWRYAENPYHLGECDEVAPVYSPYDVAMTPITGEVKWRIRPELFNESLAGRFAAAWLDPDYMPATLSIDDEYGWWKLPPLPLAIARQLEMDKAPMPSGMIPDEDIFAVDHGTRLKTARMDLVRYAAAPAQDPPEYFTDQYAERPSFLQRVPHELFKQFLKGVAMKFKRPLDGYLPEHEEAAAKEMIEAYQKINPPDYSKFIESSGSLEELGEFGKYIEHMVDLEGIGRPKIVQNPDSDGKAVAVVFGEPYPGMPVRIHSRCFYGDVLNSTDCDCGPQLHLSLQLFAKQGGVLIYMDDEHEGRGSGLVAKGCGYSEKEATGTHTFNAYAKLGLRPDSRTYLLAMDLLNYLDHRAGGKLKNPKKGTPGLRLLTSSPWKAAWVRAAGFTCTTKPIEPDEIVPVDYLTAKKDIMLYDLARQLLSKHEKSLLEAAKARAEILSRLAGKVRLRGEEFIPVTQLREAASAIPVGSAPIVSVVGSQNHDTHAITRGKDVLEVLHEKGGKGYIANYTLSTLEVPTLFVTRSEDAAEVSLPRKLKKSDPVTEYSSLARPGKGPKVIIKSNILDNSNHQDAYLPYEGMPTARDVQKSDNSLLKGYVTSWDLPLRTLQKVIEVAGGRLLIGHVVGRPRLIKKLEPLVPAFHVLTMNRQEAAIMLDIEYWRIMSMTNADVAELVRAKTRVGSIFVTDPNMGIGCSSDQGTFSLAGLPDRLRWGIVGANSVVTAALTAGLLDSDGDVRHALAVAHRAGIALVSRPGSLRDTAKISRDVVGLRSDSHADKKSGSSRPVAVTGHPRVPAAGPARPRPRNKPPRKPNRARSRR